MNVDTVKKWLTVFFLIIFNNEQANCVELFHFENIDPLSEIASLFGECSATSTCTIRVRNMRDDCKTWVKCASKDDSTGWQNLEPSTEIVLKFKPRFGCTILFGRTLGCTHFWCDVEADGLKRHFPVYGEGAPRQSNVYQIKPYVGFVFSHSL